MKTICVPKNVLAQERLDYDVCEEGDLIRFDLDNDSLQQLFNSGFFYRINKIANRIIDDYESEEITSQLALLQVVNDELFDDNKYDAELANTIRKIKELF